MSAVDDIMSQIPMASLADQLGVDQSTAEAAVRQTLPALVGGMEANAADPAGAASLQSAIDQHSSALVDGGVNLNDVDTEDGEKIVGHVFGDNSDQVVQTLGGNLGGSNNLVKQLLPILAPIVLSYLTKQLAGRGQQDQAAATGGGGLQDILGSILGGMGGAGAGGQGGGGQGGGGLGDILGGLLGGGRR